VLGIELLLIDVGKSLLEHLLKFVEVRLRNLADISYSQLALRLRAVALRLICRISTESLVGVGRVVVQKVSESDFPHLSNELLLQVVPVINFAFMQVEKKQQQEGQEVAFYFYVLDFVNVEEDVTVNLLEAKDHAQYF